MAELVVLVLNDPDRLEDVLDAWLKLGVPGVTTLYSQGLRQEIGKRQYRDDLPLFPSMEDLFQGSEEHSVTLLAVVPENFDVESLVKALEPITGPLEGPNTGILFTLPVGRVWGLRGT